MEILYDRTKIEEMVWKVAIDILKNESMYPDIVIPIMNGAMFFAADLLRDLYPHISPVLAHIKTTRLPSFVKPGQFTISANASGLDIHGGLQNKRVLLVDTVFDTGASADAAKRLVKARYCRSVLIAALVWKNLPTATGKPDYFGADLDGNPKYLVGYGLDNKDGKHRNAAHIYCY